MVAGAASCPDRYPGAVTAAQLSPAGSSPPQETQVTLRAKGQAKADPAGREGEGQGRIQPCPCRQCRYKVQEQISPWACISSCWQQRCRRYRPFPSQHEESLSNVPTPQLVAQHPGSLEPSANGADKGLEEEMGAARVTVKHHSILPAFCQTKAISRNWDAQIQHLCSTVPTPPTPRALWDHRDGP